MARSRICAATSQRGCTDSTTAVSGVDIGNLGPTTFTFRAELLLKQQPLPRLHQRRGDHLTQPAIAQTQTSCLAKPVGGLFVALLVERLQATEQHGVAQRVVEFPLTAVAGGE